MSTAENKIISKFQALDEYVTYLKDLQKVNKKSFFSDYHFYGLAEHYLHLSIEATLDVSKLLIIAYRFPRPELQRDLMQVLFDRKVITEKLFHQLIGMSGFRNILIHEYERVDKKHIYDFLQNNINQFSDFKRAVLKYLKKHPC